MPREHFRTLPTVAFVGLLAMFSGCTPADSQPPRTTTFESQIFPAPAAPRTVARSAARATPSEPVVQIGPCEAEVAANELPDQWPAFPADEPLAFDREPTETPAASAPSPATRPDPRSATPLMPTARGGLVQVRGYTRKDGTYVAPHTRAMPGTGGGKK